MYLQFKPDEIHAIIKDFDEPGTLAPTGLLLGGTKYMVIQGEAGAVIRGKKVCFYFIALSFFIISFDIGCFARYFSLLLLMVDLGFDLYLAEKDLVFVR